MRRFFAVFVLFAAVVVGFAAPSSAQSLAEKVQLKWRTSAANVAGYVDSATASINGAVQTVDTTAWFATGSVPWAKGVDGITAHGCFRVLLTSSNNTSCDSIFVTVESSPDGSTVGSNTTFIAMVGTSGDEYISGVITCGSATQGTTGAATVWMQPYIRLRVRADGNTGSLFPNARVWLVYPKKGL